MDLIFMAKITIKEPKGIDVSKSSLLIDQNNARHTSNISINNPIKAITNEGLGYVRQNNNSLIEKVVSIFQIGESEEMLVVAGDAQKYWEIFTPVSDDGYLAQCFSHFIYLNKIYMYVGQINLTTFEYDKYEIQVKNFDNQLLDRFGAKGSGNVEFNGQIANIWIDSDKIYVADSRNGRVQKLDLDGTYDTQWAVEGITGVQVYDGKVYECSYAYSGDYVSMPFYIHSLTGTLINSFTATSTRCFTINNDIIFLGCIGENINKYSLAGVYQGTIITPHGDSSGITSWNNILYTSNPETEFNISKFNITTGEEIFSYGTLGYTGAINQFYYPSALRVFLYNGSYRLWIADVYNGLIKTIL